MWAAELKYHGEGDKPYESRPARTLIVYGQQLPGWEVAQLAKPLERGKAYWFSAQDNGRHGSVKIMPNMRLEPC